MQVRLLGPVDVFIGGTAVPVPGDRRRAVLAALAAAPGEVVGADRLIDVVWGDDAPATALNTLQRHVSNLRQILGADAIRAVPPGYVLDADTDAARAERLIAEADAAEPGDRAGRLRDALALWRGEPGHHPGRRPPPRPRGGDAPGEGPPHPRGGPARGPGPLPA